MQSNHQNQVVVSVDSFGVVDAPNDLAHFSLVLADRDDNLERAKQRVSERIDKVVKMFKSFQEKGVQSDSKDWEIVEKFYRLERQDRQEKSFDGFQATATITWTVKVSPHLDELYQACVGFDPRMEQPEFSLKNREGFVQQALEQAGQNVKKQLQQECQLLGVHPERLQIHNWQVGYDGKILINDFLNNAALPVAGGFYGASSGLKTAHASPLRRDLADGESRRISVAGTILKELLNPKLEPGVEHFNVALKVDYVWAV